FGVSLRIVIALSLTVLSVASVFYLFPQIEIGRGVVAIAALLSAVLTMVLRGVAYRLMDLKGFKRRVLVYGHTTRMAAFTRMRRRSDRSGYHLVGFVHHSGEPVTPLGEQVFDAPNGLRALCEEL